MRITILAQLVSHCTDIMSRIRQDVFGGEATAINSLPNGIVGWMRFEDGQLYEVVVSPADVGSHRNLLANQLGIPAQNLGSYLRREYNQTPNLDDGSKQKSEDS